MLLTPGQRLFIKNTLSVFESGKLFSVGSAATITILSDGAGYSAGSHQATDKSDSVDLIVKDYIARPCAKFAREFEAFLPDLVANASTRENPKKPSARAQAFMALWRRAAAEDTALFIASQDAVFERVYWTPVQSIMAQDKFQFALTGLVLYDTSIQSGAARIATHRQTFAAGPPKNGGDEKTWTRAYIEARAAWISSFVSSSPDKQKLVRNSVYRANELREMAQGDNWDLRLPAKVLGVTVPGAVD